MVNEQGKTAVKQLFDLYPDDSVEMSDVTL